MAARIRCCSCADKLADCPSPIDRHCRKHGPLVPCALVDRRRPPPRARDRARAGRAGLGRGGALPQLAGRGAGHGAPSCARSAPTPTPSPPTWPTRRPAARWCRAVLARTSAGSTRWSTTPRCSSTTTCDELRPCGDGRALAQQRRAGRAAGPGAACRTWTAARRRGCVVNLLDQKLWNPNPDYLSYTLSKAALRGRHRRCWRRRWRRACASCGVAPGVTLPSGPMDRGRASPRAHRLTPLQRSSTRQDIARAVRFLLESPAITGTTLLVDGGQHLAAQPRDVMFLARADLSMTQPAATTPSLADCRRLFLRDYEVWINIGVHDFEKTRRAARADQRRPVRAAGAVDAAGTTSCTRWSTTTSSAAASRERVARGHIHLQETLADDVLRADARAPAGARRARVDREARCLPRLRCGRRRSVRPCKETHEPAMNAVADAAPTAAATRAGRPSRPTSSASGCTAWSARRSPTST